MNIGFLSTGNNKDNYIQKIRGGNSITNINSTSKKIKNLLTTKKCKNWAKADKLDFTKINYFEMNFLISKT